MPQTFIYLRKKISHQKYFSKKTQKTVKKHYFSLSKTMITLLLPPKIRGDTPPGGEQKKT